MSSRRQFFVWMTVSSHKMFDECFVLLDNYWPVLLPVAVMFHPRVIQLFLKPLLKHPLLICHMHCAGIIIYCHMVLRRQVFQEAKRICKAMVVVPQPMVWVERKRKLKMMMTLICSAQILKRYVVCIAVHIQWLILDLMLGSFWMFREIKNFLFFGYRWLGKVGLP